MGISKIRNIYIYTNFCCYVDPVICTVSVTSKT